MLLALGAGLLAGALHVFAGPDHLAAVAPLSASKGRRSWSVGVSWGAGHAAGVATVGAVALLLREAIDLEGLSAWSERAVGIVLVGVGLWGLWRATSRWVHVHPHVHGPGGAMHVHVHAHRPGQVHDRAKGPHEEERARDAGRTRGEPAARGARPPHHEHRHAPVWIGALHGLAGSSHLFGVLPALALPRRLDAVSYLAGFGMGTVAAMSAFSLGVGIVATRLASVPRAGDRAYRVLLGTLSVAAVAVGVAWVAHP